jgi:hypothetical protein
MELKLQNEIKNLNAEIEYLKNNDVENANDHF